ncbi:MAG: J domain-containing protein [Lachnospiraceae bacterium]|nr:J domain-containing protein [Lachnospiraceae bacterium]
MRDAEEILQDGCEEELKELKVWLFKENIRMRELRNELEEVQSLLEKERKQFHDEMAKLTRRIEMDRKRLVQENRFFEQKMKILQSGFEKLDEDRRKFQREKDKFLTRKESSGEGHIFFHRPELTTLLFRGVNSFLALKKRYRDLVKMYHPDNVAGDQEMVQMINREYERLKKKYEKTS